MFYFACLLGPLTCMSLSLFMSRSRSMFMNHFYWQFCRFPIKSLNTVLVGLYKTANRRHLLNPNHQMTSQETTLSMMTWAGRPGPQPRRLSMYGDGCEGVMDPESGRTRSSSSSTSRGCVWWFFLFPQTIWCLGVLVVLSLKIDDYWSLVEGGEFHHRIWLVTRRRCFKRR